MSAPLVRAPQAVVVAGSAGAIEALRTILPALPAHFGFPVVALVHLPEERRSLLAEVFQPYLAMPVCEAQDKQFLEPGVVYFAGAGYHLSIEQEHSFSYSREAPLHFSRPSIDILMASAADAYGPGLLAILLSGANQDGAEGLACVKAAGGTTVVQDPEHAPMPVMPRAAIARCAPDLILPLDGIHALLGQLGAA